jgi:hypothetical protein
MAMGNNGDKQNFRKVAGWAPIAGQWTFEGATATYLGAQTNASPFGVALADIQTRDVTVRFGITFETLDNKIPDSAAGLVLGYSGMQSPYVLVQIGGWGTAYSLGQYLPSRGFIPLAKFGSLANLSPKHQYEAVVVQRGQMITLTVDKVRVVEAILPDPLSGNQLGLQAWGADKTVFSDVEALETRPRLFVAMQFSEPFDTVYKEVIERKGKDAGFDVFRIDDLTRPGIIFQDIQREIREARAVLAEISAANSNVFYELGYAHALNKPTILLARRGQQLPFDIRSYRVIFYDDTIGGKTELEDTLTKHLAAVSGDG